MSYVAPEPDVGPTLVGADLLVLINEVVAGVTGLPGDSVRPSWQTDPPNIPGDGEAWCAISVSVVDSDVYPWVGQVGERARLQSNEVLRCLCSFFDLGAGGLADYYARRLRDGLAIPQNREQMQLANVGLVEASSLVTVPVLLKQRWLYRVDMEVILSCQSIREYASPSILSASGEISSDDGYSETFVVSND